MKKKQEQNENMGFVVYQFLKVLAKVLNKVLHSKYKKFLKPVITKLYRAFRYENFAVKSEIIQVKKGKVKYKLVIVETSEGKLKVNIGRHDDKQNEKSKN